MSFIVSSIVEVSKNKIAFLTVSVYIILIDFDCGEHQTEFFIS